MSEPLLQVRGLSRSYRSGKGRIEVIRDLDVEVGVGESLAIVGQSGVGKSTLLHILGGLDRPDAGEVRFQGRNVYAGSTRDLAAYRNLSVGFIFQLHHLLPEFTAIENVEMPFRIARRRGDYREAARRLLDRLDLADRVDHYPGELSGGEQQRVAIARALVMGPSVVLADEPTGNLDPSTGAEVFRLLRDLQNERPFALVLASHSERLAAACSRLARLEAGRLRDLGAQETREYFKGLGA